MTLSDQLNQTIDRVQDVCMVDFPMDGPQQRAELWLVLCDFLALATGSPVMLPVREVAADRVARDDIRGHLASKGIRFLVLPDDFTVAP